MVAVRGKICRQSPHYTSEENRSEEETVGVC